jgi:Na+-transporting NADH:ubiquinone oxidoreductase subunit NqrF
VSYGFEFLILIVGLVLGYLLSKWQQVRKKPVKLPLNQRRFKPKAGFVWNPLLKFPRNNNCFCGSTKKAKNCCLPCVAEACSKESADALEADWEGLIRGTVHIQGANEDSAA